ncbi:hypothetical protein QR680_004678 [Steinernema hermaphroditum]|uniref:Protein kinase domain-containing protein n=1 Tax=Steinernema hermaphroditum TaxID=289476 RepID=A0AA39LUC8_9BILA|nr:hypothetical protein QR680_004678 [Steinernema hermaphroditum]
MPSSELPSSRLPDTLCPSTLAYNNFCYRKVSKLGSGTFANVYLMRNSFGHQLAAKIMETRHSFQKAANKHEVEILNRLGHPNIVKLYKVSRSNHQNFCLMLMECVPGGELSSFAATCGHDDLRAVFRQIVDAVSYLHSVNVVHCDLKPSNVLVSHTKRVKLCDFGFAQYFYFDQLNAEIPMQYRGGTCAFNSPLKLQGRPSQGTKNDVWSLGILLFNIHTRRYPWHKADAENDRFFARWVCDRQYDLFSLYDIPSDAVEVIKGALNIDEIERWSVARMKKTKYYDSFYVEQKVQERPAVKSREPVSLKKRRSWGIWNFWPLK